jgi:hypothetical protein
MPDTTAARALPPATRWSFFVLACADKTARGLALPSAVQLHVIPVTREGPVKVQVLNKPKHDAKVRNAKVEAAKVRDAKVGALTLNGIPLRRKSVWAIDTESPEFRSARKRDAKALREKPDNGDGLQFIEAVLAEKDVQKWWN